MSEPKEIKTVITHQGVPHVNHAYMVREAVDIVAFGIDLRERGCQCTVTGSSEGIPCIGVDATESKDGGNTFETIDKPTMIDFPEFDGWSVWSVEVSKYTVAVCLVKAGESS